MNKVEVTFTQLSPEIYLRIKSMVKNAIKEALEKYQLGSSNYLPPSDEDFLSAEQAATFLKIKLNTIYSKVEKDDFY